MATDSQSTVSTWACLMLSVVLLVTRLALRALRRQRFTHGDYWCLSAAVFILARVIASHFLMLYGSTRVLPPERRLVLLQPGHEAEAEKVVIGSKLILLTRSLLICLLWSLKMAVLDLLAKIMMNMPFERKLLYTLWAILASTFVASLVTVFVECPSFSMYWQLHPDPGACVVGNTWLYTYEISNIVTDALLIIVTSYVILLAKLPVNQRLRILFLFSIGIFLIAISTVRITLGKDSRIQRSHTLWASIEVLFAAVVAVTPTIYALALNRHNSANHPANSYAKSSITGAKRGVEYREYAGDPGYEARVWTELRDSGDRFRGDNASAEGILVETRVEAGEVERGVGIAVCAPLAIYQPESRSSYDKA